MQLQPKYGTTPKFPESIDSSMLTTYLRCPRLFYLEYIMGLRPVGEDRIALSYGTVWHHLQEQKNLYGFKPAYEWGEANVEDMLPSYEEKKNRTSSRILADFMVHHFEFESQLKDFEVLGVELPFDIQLGHLRYCGKIDLVARDRRSGKMYVTDYKTSTFVMPSYYMGKEMSFQFKGYAWAAQQLFPDLEFGGMILDLYHIKKNDSSFTRRPFLYHPSVIREWERNTLGYMEQIYLLAESATEEEDWLMNYEGCEKFGGCAFADVHQMPEAGNARARMIEANFAESRWDPINQEQGEVQ